MKDRRAWIDALRGFGILFVVIIHATGSSLVRSLLLSVAVPIFIFVSGFLFDRHKYRGWPAFFTRHLRTRMLPYALWVAISCVMTMAGTGAYGSYLMKLASVDSLLGFLLADFDWLNGTVQNGPLWFLPCLFLIENVFYFVARIASAMRIGVLLTVFSFGTQVIYSAMPWHVPFILNMVMTNIVFFGAGLIVRRIGETRSLPANRMLMLLMWLGAVALFLGGGARLLGSGSTLLNASVQYLVSFSGIIVFAFAAAYLGSVTWLRFLGAHTLIILVLNEPLRRTTNRIFASISFSFFDDLFRLHRELFTVLQVVAVFMLVVPCIYLINSRLPFLIGKSPPAARRPS